MTTKKYHNSVFVRGEFEIIKSIASGNSRVSSIARDLNRDKSNTGKTLKRLVEKKLVIKKVINCKNVDYYLTPKCQQILGSELMKSNSTTILSSGVTNNQKEENNNLRMEYISVKYKILNVRHSWKYGKERPIGLTLRDIDFNTANLKNNKIYSFTMQNITVKFSSSSVMINFPEESTVNPQMMWANILYRLPFIVNKIEREYNIKLSEEINIVSQEVALIKSALGSYAEKTENDRYYIFYDPVDGKPRWKLDKSKGFLEWEWMHRLFADEDFEILNKDLLYDFVNNKCYKPSETRVKIEGLEYEKQELYNKYKLQTNILDKIIEDKVENNNILVSLTKNQQRIIQTQEYDQELQKQNQIIINKILKKLDSI